MHEGRVWTSASVLVGGLFARILRREPLTCVFLTFHKTCGLHELGEPSDFWGAPAHPTSEDTAARAPRELIFNTVEDRGKRQLF